MQWLLLTFDACDVYDEDARRRSAPVQKCVSNRGLYRRTGSTRTAAVDMGGCSDRENRANGLKVCGPNEDELLPQFNILALVRFPGRRRVSNIIQPSYVHMPTPPRMYTVLSSPYAVLPFHLSPPTLLRSLYGARKHYVRRGQLGVRPSYTL